MLGDVDDFEGWPEGIRVPAMLAFGVSGSEAPFDEVWRNARRAADAGYDAASFISGGW